MASFLGRNSFSTDYDSNAWLHILLYILYLDYQLDGRRFLWKDMTKGLQDQCNDKTPFVAEDMAESKTLSKGLTRYTWAFYRAERIGVSGLVNQLIIFLLHRTTASFCFISVGVFFAGHAIRYYELRKITGQLVFCQLFQKFSRGF